MAKPFQFRLRTLLLAFVPVAVMALAVGWSLRRPRPIPVSGTVTLDGQPLAGCQITFRPIDPIDPSGRSPGGMTDSTGAFRLLSLIVRGKRLPGAFPGGYEVAVVNGRNVRVVPVRYANAATSGLTAEVAKFGHNDFTFNLTTPPKN
jgi:hypothetical protein